MEPARGLVYWLPVVVILLTMLAANHHLWYAAEATGEDFNDVYLSDEVGGTTATRQIGFLTLGCIGMCLLYAQPATERTTNSFLMFLVVALNLVVLGSALWSEELGLSFRRALIPALMWLGAIGTARHWRSIDLCRCALFISFTMLLIGVVAELQAGTFLGAGEYRFSGTLHANRQAANCGLIVLSSACLFASERKLRWLMLFVVGATFLTLTSSRGATIAILIALGMVSYAGATLVHRVLIFLGLATALSIAMMFLSTSDIDMSQPVEQLVRMGRVEDTVGEVSSLTGRIPIWVEAFGDIVDRPILGYGYGAFWTPDRVHAYSYIHNWAFNNAHSIYLESLLNVGAVGLGIGLVIAIITFFDCAKWFRKHREPGDQFVMGLIAFAAVHGVVEAIYITAGLPLILCMIGVGLAIYRQHEEQEDTDE